MAKSKPIKIPLRSEHEEQVAFFNEVRLRASMGKPHWNYIFAVPNGAKLPYTRSKTGKIFSPQRVSLTAEGMLAGVLDICCPFPRGKYHGLWIELKRKPNKPSPEQVDFIRFLTEQGYAALVCWDAKEAMDALINYDNVK